jgi:hypothetical protein
MGNKLAKSLVAKTKWDAQSSMKILDNCENA